MAVKALSATCSMTDACRCVQTRQVAGSTFLEACIENSSKGPMSLEYVRFDATPPLVAHNIDIRDAMLDDFTTEDPLSGYIDQLQARAYTV